VPSETKNTVRRCVMTDKIGAFPASGNYFRKG
jgi:hypothetical protein